MNPLVSILMGSKSDWPTLETGAKVLDTLQVPYEVRVLSAHRAPDALVEYVKGAEKRGLEVFIAAAGGAAHLPGVVAAHTVLPVLGVPIESPSFKGLDSLLSIVQMPRGVPVGTVAVNGAANAALLAVRILAVGDGALARQLTTYQTLLSETARAQDAALGAPSG